MSLPRWHVPFWNWCHPRVTLWIPKANDGGKYLSIIRWGQEHIPIACYYFFVCTLIIIDKQITIHESPLYISVENLKFYSSKQTTLFALCKEIIS